jgi:hypothetical protein
MYAMEMDTLEGVVDSQEHYISRLEELLVLAVTTNITNAELKRRHDRLKGIKEESGNDEETWLDSLPF